MIKIHARGALAALAIAIGLAGGGVALADKSEHRHGARGRDGDVHQDAIMEALKRNEIRPLAEVSAVAEQAIPGQVVGVRVKRLEGRLVYEFKIITSKGRVREVYIDAANLNVLKTE